MGCRGTIRRCWSRHREKLLGIIGRVSCTIRTRRGHGKVSQTLEGRASTKSNVGDGFKVYDLPPPLNRTVLGICMGAFLQPYGASSANVLLQT